MKWLKDFIVWLDCGDIRPMEMTNKDLSDAVKPEVVDPTPGEKLVPPPGKFMGFKITWRW